MADGTVRGVFSLDAAQPLRDLAAIRDRGREADAALGGLGRQMDQVGGSVAERRLESYRGKLESVGTTAEQTAAKVTVSWAEQRKSIDDESTRIEARVDLLEARIDRFGRKRATAGVDLTGYDLVNAQLTELEARLDRLGHQRATPRVSLGGGFSNIAGGGGGAVTSATRGGGGGGGGMFSSLGGIPGMLPWWAMLVPFAPQLAGGAVGLAGSAGSAALGVGAIGAGAAGALGFGGALSYGMGRNVVTELGNVTKAQKAYNLAVQEYGRSSAQAATEKRKLDAQMVQAGPQVVAAARQYQMLSSTLERVTAGGRAGIAGGISRSLYNFRRAAPQLQGDFTMAGQATGNAAASYTGFLSNPQSIQTYHTLTAAFATELPTVERSLQNITLTFEHLAVAALPFFHEANVWVETWTAGMARSTGDTARVQQSMGKMVNSAKDWGRLLDAAYHTIRDLFSAGVPSGDSMVVQLTNSMNVWDKWIRDNPDKVRRFFSDAEQAVGRIATTIGNLTKDVFQLFQSVMPLINGAERFIQFVSTLGGGNIAVGGALLYGAYTGGRAALGGRGPSAGALAQTMILGNGLPAVRSASRGGGGMIVAPGVANTMTAQEARMAQVAGQYAPGSLAPGAALSRVSSMSEQQMMMEAQLAAGTTGVAGLLSRGRTLAGGALGGVARFALPAIAITSLLQGLSTPGGMYAKAGSALNTASFGLVPKNVLQTNTGHTVLDTLAGGTAGLLLGGPIGGVLGAVGGATFGGAAAAGASLGNKTVQGDLTRLGQQAGSVRSVAQLQQVDAQIGRVRLLGYEMAPGEKAKLESYLSRVSNTATANVAAASANSWQDAFTRALDQGRKPQKAVDLMLAGMRDQFKQLGPKGAKDFASDTAQWVRQMELDNPQLRRPLERLMNQIVGDLNSMHKQTGNRFRDMQREIFYYNGQIYQGTDSTWSAISSNLVDKAAVARDKLNGIWGQIQQEAINALTQMGFSKQQAQQIVTSTTKGGVSAKIAGQTVGAVGQGALPSTLITNPNNPFGPSGPANIHARGGVLGGSGLLDTVPLPDGSRAAPGEAWIANRHTMMALDAAAVDKYGKTAWQMIRDETRPHSAPMHYRFAGSNTRALMGSVGTSVSVSGGGATSGSGGFGPGYGGGGYSLPLPRGQMMPGSWSIDQGVDIPAPANTPEYAIGPGTVTGAGISGFGPNAPILRINTGPLGGRSIYYGHAGPNVVPVGANVNAGQQISEVGAGIVGISTGPHLEIGFYPPGAMGSGNSMATVLRQLMSGSTITGVAGGAGAAGVTVPQLNIKAPVSGLPGMPGALVDRASQKLTGAMNQSVNSRISSMLPGAGLAGNTAGGSAGANQALGHQMMLAAGWPESQWPSLLALWNQESGWNANSVNPSSGAAGIPQALGHGNVFPLGNASAQIAWGLNYIRGRYGSPAAAEAHERAFNWYQRGGRFAGENVNWAGWAARGADFITHGPTIVGAGERGAGPERVTVTPVGRRGASGGGHHIVVRMENVHLSAQPHEIEKIGRHVAEKIIDALDEAAAGVSDQQLMGVAP